jgi:UDP-N-acetylmuramoyl-tripeptide--D-alanyl-D-alanine ligase
MDPLSIEQITHFAGAVRQDIPAERIVTHLSTDSRTVQPGDLFVALRGENFDGHKFVNDAFLRGAVGAIVEQKWSGKAPPAFALLRVTDTLAAYQQIAAHYRRSLGIKVVAITGSNGKTSTKDFVGAVLERGFRVLKTEGNFNNHVGVPRMLLRAGSTDQIAVLEMGMNHAGEIRELAAIARPDVGVRRTCHEQHPYAVLARSLGR